MMSNAIIAHSPSSLAHILRSPFGSLHFSAAVSYYDTCTCLGAIDLLALYIPGYLALFLSGPLDYALIRCWAFTYIERSTIM